MSLTLVILAAGLSSRYGGGMKQTDAVGPSGETLIDYGVYDASRAGFTRVVFVIRPEIEDAFHECIDFRLNRLDRLHRVSGFGSLAFVGL